MSSYKLYKNLETSWALLVYEIPSSNIIILWKPKILYLKYIVIGFTENMYLLMKMWLKWKFQQQKNNKKIVLNVSVNWGAQHYYV